MAEQEKVKHTNELSFEDKVLEKIAFYTVDSVDGILELQGNFTSGIKDFFSSNGDETKGVNAEVGKKEVALDLEIVAEYGKNIPTAFERAVEEISKNVEKMTGLKVVEINMNVNDVVSRAEYEKNKTEEQRKKAEERRQANRNGEYSDGSRVQ
ncbi:Asp23/Gls24 family envelope stress response protein [Aerococcus kribbianus]|uniref:Stress response regulator gls24 homolog n=1 Tax=Aerococcus kribbianus TaxID=2999064 RepID=A0A9X3FPU0_9LACT|nr:MULTISPECIES: Asp23/Gls24 family envelope stress response protein [unclassified Aerococcus]MCZ0717758.1 Asp23/Gls24 family envelope stress response protein [Aerococcus sp. YH-aer221]MCZ0726046.1 Asp23/Gls24 family envelope stress response protein [Aerococcus sp. YH-aer222]